MNMLFNSPGRSVRNGKNCAPVLSAAGSLWPRAVFKTPGRVFPIQITPLVNNIYIYIYIYVLHILSLGLIQNGIVPSLTA